MNFSKIYVEHELRNHPRTLHILDMFKSSQIISIDRYDQYWGRKKKPYLQKREDLRLYLAQKKGELVKSAPAAYGQKGDPHYFFIHSYNCIYECEYCYLQGYFHTPDIVLFLNYEDILEEIKNKIALHPKRRVWFHAGEYSDSLALNQLTQEWELFWKTFEQLPEAYLELRTKSVNIRHLLELKPLKNIIVSYSLSPTKYDRGAPSLHGRLKAIEKLVDHGHQIGLHFDPIIYHSNFLNEYEQLTSQVADLIPPENLAYISLGVVRFTKDVFSQVEKNYPDSPIIKNDLIKSEDGKIKYPRAVRNKILQSIRELLLQKEIGPEIIYLCME